LGKFGDALRSIREQRGWTLDEMAKKLNTTKQALSRYERGERTPKITVAAKFAEILDVPLELLLGYEYHEDPDSAGRMRLDLFGQDDPEVPKTVEARCLAKGIDRMPKAQREAILNVMMGLYPGKFEKGNEDDDT